MEVRRPTDWFGQRCPISTYFFLLLTCGLLCVTQVRAEDSDTGANGNVTYSLVKSIDQDSDRFTIDPVTGVIVTAEVFDREARTGKVSRRGCSCGALCE